MGHPRPKRVIGIAVSKKNLGFCVLEHPDFLLDWGVKKMKDRKPETIERLLSHIFNFYQPSHIILENTLDSNCNVSKENIFVLQSIILIAKNMGVPTLVCSWAKIKECFGLEMDDALYSLVTVITQKFPTLFSPPPIRQVWECEHRGMVLMKAICISQFSI